jgi:hypothetical protein
MALVAKLSYLFIARLYLFFRNLRVEAKLDGVQFVLEVYRYYGIAAKNYFSIIFCRNTTL